METVINFNDYKRKKGYVRRCSPIDRILGKTPTEILNEFGNTDEIPINLNYILERIGIPAIPMDFSSMETKLQHCHILGLVSSDNKNAVIYYSANDTPYRQRFAIAHELGNICKNFQTKSNEYPSIDWSIEENAENEDEMAANIFAEELLIPLKKLKKAYMRMSYPSSASLAKEFGTSIHVMEKRLEHLKATYYNTDGKAVIYGQDYN